MRALGETHILTIFFTIHYWQFLTNFTLFRMMKNEEIILKNVQKELLYRNADWESDRRIVIRQRRTTKQAASALKSLICISYIQVLWYGNGLQEALRRTVQ